MRFLCHAWNLIPPGAFIALLGFSAAVMAFFDPPKKGPRRALWIGFFFLLMVGEIFVLRRESRIGEEHFAYISSHFEEQGKLSASVLEVAKAVEKVSNFSSSVKSKSSIKLIEKPSLKLKALELSESILNFLAGRAVGGPPTPKPQTWEQDVKVSDRYDQETIALYKQMYNPKVAEMHAEFAAQGLHNELLDAFYKDPHNLAGIRMIAEAIGGMFGLAYQVKN